MNGSILPVAFALSLIATGTAAADVEYVPLDAPCDGKEGLAVANYGWLDGTRAMSEFLFTEVCLDLTRMKVFSVEESDPFVLAFKGPGHREYHAYPPGYTDRYRETMTLFIDASETGTAAENTGRNIDPEAPGNVARYTWQKLSDARPLDRIGKGSVLMQGFVGGETPSGNEFIGRYDGWGTSMPVTYRDPATGLGFVPFWQVELNGTHGTVRHVSDGEVAALKNSEISLALRLDGARITGTGHATAENGILAPANGHVWKSFEMTTKDVIGRVMGEDGDSLYFLAVFEGSYTNFAGEVLRATAAVTFYGERQAGTDNPADTRANQTGAPG